jgi:hypothetical protein
MIEMLCLQWGFYFNAAKSDLESSDLSQLADFIDKKIVKEQGPEQNTAFARNMTLVLFLSRLLVFKYCLQVPNNNSIMGRRKVQVTATSEGVGSRKH